MVISVQYRETQTTMKKISLLFFFALLIIFNKSVLGNEDLVIDAPSPLPSEQYITEEHLLDEIESLQDRLDSLVANGRLSASAAMTASGVLATLAFGVFRIAFYARAVEDKWMYEWDTGDWEGVILYSLMDSVLPALGIGGLMGFTDTPRPIGRGFLDRSKNLPASTRLPWIAVFKPLSPFQSLHRLTPPVQRFLYSLLRLCPCHDGFCIQGSPIHG